MELSYGDTKVLLAEPYPRSRSPPLGTRNFVLTKPRGSLRLVDLSRIPSGTFFREVHPGSEMARKIHQKMMWHDESWRFVTEPRSHGLASRDPRHSSGLLRTFWLDFDAPFGAGWTTWDVGPYPNSRLSRCPARSARRGSREQVFHNTTRWQVATFEGQSRTARTRPWRSGGRIARE